MLVLTIWQQMRGGLFDAHVFYHRIHVVFDCVRDNGILVHLYNICVSGFHAMHILRIVRCWECLHMM